MKARASAKVKLPEDSRLKETLKACRNATQFCLDQGLKHGYRTRVKLHEACYYRTRKRFVLPSNLAIGAISKALEILKNCGSNNKRPKLKRLSARYNTRTFSIKHGWKALSILTLQGRIELEIKIPKCYEKYLDWDYGDGTLMMDRKGKLFFCFNFAKEVHVQEFYRGCTGNRNKILGVDLGVNKLAATSDNCFYGGKFKEKRSKRDKVVASLQCKGTPSAKRTLKCLSGRWKRFQHWLCHDISKRIVGSLEVGDVLVLEDLKAIRESRNCKHNKWVHKWPFRQLQQFLEYKALRKGVRVVYVNPKNTSKRCSRCGSLQTERHGAFFECENCKFKLDVDLNAARNLAQRYMRNWAGAPVGEPEAPRAQSFVP